MVSIFFVYMYVFLFFDLRYDFNDVKIEIIKNVIFVLKL